VYAVVMGIGIGAASSGYLTKSQYQKFVQVDIDVQNGL
jgi:hypothetical protein